MKSEIDLAVVWIPQGETLSVHRVSKLFTCTPQHIRNLIEEGAIKVPAEEIARARSKQKTWTTVRVLRESLVEFVRIRSSPQWRKAHRRSRA